MATNRITRALLAGAISLAAGASAIHARAQQPCPAKSVQQIVLYKNAWTPIEGNVEQNWKPQSHAYTAGTFYMPFDDLKAGGAVVCRALLSIVWQARSPSAYTGVGVFAVPPLSAAGTTEIDKLAAWWTFVAANDDGPAPWTPPSKGYYETYPTCSGSGSGPHPCGLDITDVMNSMISGGKLRVPQIVEPCEGCLDVELPGGQPYYFTIGSFGNGQNGPWIYQAEISISWGS